MRPSSSVTLPLLTTSLLATLPLVTPAVAHAQDLRYRLWRPSAVEHTAQQNAQQAALRLAQVDRPTTPGAAAPVPEAAPGSADPNAPVTPKQGRAPIAFSVITRFGFDSDKLIVNVPTPVEFNVKRRIRTLVVAADYPLNDRTLLSLSVPYIDQTTKNTSNIGNITQRGSGIGDIALWLERSYPNYKKAREISLAAGMVFPTGKSPFGLGPTELETGLGFYQPSFRITARTLNVPLQFFGAVDYSTAIKRSDGNKLPASYGGEMGFFYTMGPEWTTQTSVSIGKVSSPFLNDTSSTVGYLTQALNYRSGDRTSFRGSVDVGLTDASTDAYVGFSVNSSF